MGATTMDDPVRRKELMKHLILQLHEGSAPEFVRGRLIQLLGQVPYDEVVEVEQELIESGELPVEEILRLCDVHTAAMEGAISQEGAPEVPPGHPVDTFRRENAALLKVVDDLDRLRAEVEDRADGAPVADLGLGIAARLRDLADVEKHYQRKENLLFPFLEKHGITGPPTVMWGKHDQTRAMLRDAREALSAAGAEATAGELGAVLRLVVKPATDSVAGMVDKEEQILLPMCLDTLDADEWVQVARGETEIGYCLVGPAADWVPAPANGTDAASPAAADGRVRMPSGTVTVPELTAMLNALPLDVTFVDANDTVRYFSEPRERIFPRTRAVIGRRVQLCHPPSSVHVVNRILDAFRSGEKDTASFWIEMRGRFLHIDYTALRGPDGAYLGCLESTQDLTEKRALTGQRRLLNWEEGDHGSAS